VRGMDFEKVPGCNKSHIRLCRSKGENPTYETYANMGYISRAGLLWTRKKYLRTAFKYFCTILILRTERTVYRPWSSYRSAIFYHDDEQEADCRKIKTCAEKSGKLGNLCTDLIKLTKFYPAEEYHQNYHSKNPLRYNYYRHGSGRDKTVKKLWGNETGLEPPAG